MKKIFQHLKKRGLTSFITSRFRKKSTIENYYLEASTKIGGNITLPLTFDFVAYYNDIELENNFMGISTDNPPEDSTSFMVDKADQDVNRSMLNPNLHCCYK
jgi:hypothetical protein